MILECLKADAEVSVVNLCRKSGNSDMTIRRDLAEMDRAGLVRRVHGGAVVPDGRAYEPPFALRGSQHEFAKRSIAARALEFIRDGDSVALDVGTTVLKLADLLNQRRSLTILTASIPVVQHLIEAGKLAHGHRLIVTGGEVRSGELSMVGDLAQRTYRELHVDKAFLSVGGISLGGGLTEFNHDDALVKRELVRTAKTTYVLADSSKFGRTAFAAVSALDDVAAYITGEDAPETVLSGLRMMGLVVHTVPVH